MPRVLIVRGHQATPWELRQWRELPPRFEVELLLTRSNAFASPADARAVRVHALRDLLPRGRIGDAGALLLGDRYLDAGSAFARADVVHGEELSYWFAAEAAKHRARGRFRLVQTVWETLPMLDAYRNLRARRHRAQVLAHTDLFLPATERAANALRLEGVAEERIRLCPPGIDTERFASAAAAARQPPPGDAAVASATPGAAATAAERPDGAHTLLSPGRLVWEKGHHDVLRALAALHRGIVTLAGGETVRPRLLIVGSGPEQGRLREHARELGLGESVRFDAVPYERMPAVFASASAIVLASQGSASAGLHPFDVPHAFWEEQFGFVLAEALAAGLPIVTTSSGAIPEVLDGADAQLVAPGDWLGIARALASGPLSRPPAQRVSYPAELIERYSTAAAAARLADAYDAVLAR